MSEQESNTQEKDYSSLSEAELNRDLYRADRDAEIFIRNRTRSHVTPEQILRGEAAIAQRNKIFIEVLRRSSKGTLEGIQVDFRAVVTLPVIPGDQRDFKGRIDLGLNEVGPEAVKILKTTSASEADA